MTVTAAASHMESKICARWGGYIFLLHWATFRPGVIFMVDLDIFWLS